MKHNLVSSLPKLNNRTGVKIGYANMFYLFVVLVYLIAAINSVGYFQEDEHYQIVEFANYKMNWIAPDNLAWEFHEQIRPALQPFLCFVVFKVCSLIPIDDGYDLILVLRLLSAGVSLIAIKIFSDSYKNHLDEKLRPYFIGLSFLLWFVPFVSVRFSSENWSGIFFILSLAALNSSGGKAPPKSYFLIGLLLGASILFRYQSALLVSGILFWLIIILKIQPKKFIILTSAIGVMLVIGFFIDHWLYGNYPITFYNYFFQNIVKDVASSFGISPWYEYILYIIKSPGPIGIFIFISFLAFMYYQPKHVVLWAILPFLLVHSIIPHKELRFLFPLVYIVPLMLILAYQSIQRKISSKINATVVVLLILCNVPGLLAVCSTGASRYTSVSNFIHRHYKQDQINVILIKGINPFIDWYPPFNTFYSSRDLNIKKVNSIWQTDFLRYQKSGLTNLLVVRNSDINGTRAPALLKKYGLKKVYQNVPAYLIPIYELYNASLKEAVITVYEFK